MEFQWVAIKHQFDFFSYDFTAFTCSLVLEYAIFNFALKKWDIALYLGLIACLYEMSYVAPPIWDTVTCL